MRRHWLLSTLCLATSPVWAAEQFDLVCSGTLETVTDVVSGLNVKNIKNQQPWSGRIQVDLDAKQYCFSAECPAASVIFDVAPDKIVFSPINALSGGGEYAEVSRVDGHFPAIIREKHGDIDISCHMRKSAIYPISEDSLLVAISPAKQLLSIKLPRLCGFEGNVNAENSDVSRGHRS